MPRHAPLPGLQVHRVRIVFPVGLLATAVVFDLIDIATNTGAFAVPAYWLIAAGWVGGLAAASFGFADWLRIPQGAPARWIGAFHGIGTVVALALFALSWLLRDVEGSVPVAALAMSVTGGLVLLFTASLGGVLVRRFGIGAGAEPAFDGANSTSFEESVSHPAMRAR